ncbi:Pimeloyl-ACP methyl ester carboxylesterase [Colwellia chukchiensis]|uniref:Pimeloyl-ACP methyl ester carboxylesterase n=1 Tax=Colwellia chukchiensis TaxID=641665 RepID=A0A1H7KBJ2_9GAMM|nr:alpha/beta hydrolase [Colwellia chukchiensis]SEK84199.1 Pimeloyl-ACP methyl ester carboxylesterase [Colwellia chukchiensis]
MLLTASNNAVEFTVNGRKISGISYGNAQQPLLLCLHGWLDNAASFLPLMPYLDDYYVIAIDWPGHGLSSHRSADAHYHFVDWVYDLVSLFQAQGWQAIDIVGHSMGAMVASAFAAAFPEYVKSLTLIDAIGFITTKPEATTKQLRKGLLSRLPRANKVLKYHASLDSAIKARVSVSDLDYDNARLIVQRGIEQNENGFSWRSDKRLRMTSAYRLTMAQAKQLLASITMPVQLLYGSQGMATLEQGIAIFAPQLNDLTLHKLEGGHHVHMEQAEQTAKLIKNFVQ